MCDECDLKINMFIKETVASAHPLKPGGMFFGKNLAEAEEKSIINERVANCLKRIDALEDLLAAKEQFLLKRIQELENVFYCHLHDQKGGILKRITT